MLWCVFVLGPSSLYPASRTKPGQGRCAPPAGCPSGQWERTVNPSAYAYAGSNPAPATSITPGQSPDRRPPTVRTALELPRVVTTRATSHRAATVPCDVGRRASARFNCAAGNDFAASKQSDPRANVGRARTSPTADCSASNVPKSLRNGYSSARPYATKSWLRHCRNKVGTRAHGWKADPV
jgi:hypothetical protein